MLSYKISYLAQRGVIMVSLDGCSENLQTLTSERITHVLQCSFLISNTKVYRKKHAMHAEEKNKYLLTKC